MFEKEIIQGKRSDLICKKVLEVLVGLGVLPSLIISYLTNLTSGYYTQGLETVAPQQ